MKTVIEEKWDGWDEVVCNLFGGYECARCGGHVGYCIEIDGKVFSFLTDLGEITPTAAHYISKAHYLILEANYDEEMLKMYKTYFSS